MMFEAIFRDTPEEWNGLLVYPVKMRDYPLFLTTKECIISSQQSWPLPWSTVKYLDGLIGMGMLPQLGALLQISLRLDGENLTIYPRMKGETLSSLFVVQGNNRGEITAKNFGELRAILARQNGLELPDERLNGEIIQAQKDLNAGDIRLKASLEDLIYSVALKSHTSPEEVMDWTVRRFQGTERSIDRSVGHLISSVTLAAGGKFKGGSPYPSWKYDREEQTNAIEPLSALSGRLSGSVEQK